MSKDKKIEMTQVQVDKDLNKLIEEFDLLKSQIKRIEVGYEELKLRNSELEIAVYTLDEEINAINQVLYTVLGLEKPNAHLSGGVSLEFLTPYIIKEDDVPN